MTDLGMGIRMSPWVIFRVVLLGVCGCSLVEAVS
jgi:hypothetical protein